MDILRAASKSPKAIAVKTARQGGYSYEQLLGASERLAGQLGRTLPAAKGADGPRVGIFAEPGPGYVAATWASWMAGAIAVPLAVSHPPEELRYVMEDAGISTVLAPPSSLNKLQGPCSAAGAKLQELSDEMLVPQPVSSSQEPNPQDDFTTLTTASSSSSGSQTDSSGALIVYTSGTTGRPKGALHTHGSLWAQVQCLVSAWQWAPSDTIVHALPLHHVHGVINALYCAHAVGATVNFLPRFSPTAMWEQLMAGDVSVLMAVPTMYSYLLSHYEHHMSPEEQAAAQAAVSKLRLTVSGSAAAPVPLLQRWQGLSEQMLLERYGMTETGMILSNPYAGERRPGFVGVPLPGVNVKVVQPGSSSSSTASNTASSSNGNDAASEGGMAGTPQGELAVRGAGLFREYWGRPEATAAAFDAEGYFLTGDTVSLEGEPPYFKIMGRTSVDIIKSGGYKLSALDIESTLLHHPDVAEAAVLGVPDEDLGQVVTALVYPKAQQDPDGMQQLKQRLVGELMQLCKQKLARYSVPRKWLLLDSPLPRNAMGKVNKKELLKSYQN